MWELINASGSKPSGRNSHVAAWSDAANGMYILGGWTASGAGPREVRPVWDGRSEGSWTSCGSSAARLALGVEHEFEVIPR